jgi:transposase InsO family protein
MPWQEVSVMEQRREFARLAQQDGANRRELCRRFGISAQTGYKWLGRSAAGDAELSDHSRRPLTSPRRTAADMETQVLAVRDAHPAWGARKLVHCLIRQGIEPPAASTVHEILRRHGRMRKPGSWSAAPQRFEMNAPNLLWQMDFKGWLMLADGTRCHALTMLDDHSRYLLCLKACADEQSVTVRGHLETTFRRYGLPEAMFVDNGSPWGDRSGQRWTRLGVWLLKLGVRLLHSRPFHPQSRGKNERLHRTLDVELFALRRLRDLAEAQRVFDLWRDTYNLDRPHEALDQEVPASRYRPSARSMPDKLVEPEYEPGEIVRKVSSTRAYVSFKGRQWPVGQAFFGERLAIRPRGQDGHYGIFFGAHQIAAIDLTQNRCVSHVSEQVSTMSPD